jgi:hypothetical protein
MRFRAFVAAVVVFEIGFLLASPTAEAGRLLGRCRKPDCCPAERLSTFPPLDESWYVFECKEDKQRPGERMWYALNTPYNDPLTPVLNPPDNLKTGQGMPWTVCQGLSLDQTPCNLGSEAQGLQPCPNPIHPLHGMRAAPCCQGR